MDGDSNSTKPKRVSVARLQIGESTGDNDKDFTEEVNDLTLVNLFGTTSDFNNGLWNIVQQK